MKIALALLLWFTACDDATPMAHFARDRVRVQCEKDFACCSLGESRFQNGLVPVTVDDCVARHHLPLGDLQHLEEQGLLVFDPQKAQECINTLTAMTCAEFFFSNAVNWDDYCTDPFLGNVPNGAPCTGWEECASSYCFKEVSYGIPEYGICREFGDVGEACQPYVGCREGLHCDDSNRAAPSCQPQRPLGTECNSYQGWPQQCARGLTCLADAAGVQRCSTPVTCDGR